MTTCFSSHVCFLLILFCKNTCFVSTVFSRWNLCSSAFLWSLHVFYRCINVIFNAGKSFSFSWNSRSTLSQWCMVLWILMGFCSLVPSFTSRMFPSILRGQPWDLSLWWNFFHIVWSQVVSSFSWETILNVFLHFHMFDGVCSRYSHVYIISFSPSNVIFS